jgi:glycosyltransferase involved in cell wall biosynthesis
MIKWVPAGSSHSPPTRSTSPRVLHVITGLFRGGGAETLLVRMLDELGEERRGHSVLSLRPRWALADEIEEMGVPVQALGMSERPTPGDVFRLGQALRRSGADVIQTWMLHSNFLAGLVARAVSRTPVVWGVHIGEGSRATLSTTAVAVQRAEAICSWFVPSRIVACSVTSREVMEGLRYRRSRIVTIPNGFDVGRFKPDPRARDEVRSELGLSPTTTVVGHLARFHPFKDHPNLLAAAGEVIERTADVRFVLCGDRVTPDNPELAPLAAPLGDRVLLLGQRKDIPRMLNAFDLAVSSSSGWEALPLAIGEAMATGLPVAATRAGDAEEIIGDTGAIAPVSDPAALAEAIIKLIELDPERRAELGRRARDRIRTNYSMQNMVDAYSTLWAEHAA